VAQAEVRLCAFDFASVSRALPLKDPVILSAAKDPSSPFVPNEHPRANSIHNKGRRQWNRHVVPVVSFPSNSAGNSQAQRAYSTAQSRAARCSLDSRV
jgi:hypothetical protein